MSQPNMVPVEMNNNVRDGDNNNVGDGDNNNNGNTTTTNNMNSGIVLGNEEFDSANSNTLSENQNDGNDNHQDPARPCKRKRYHRHTKQQTQELENFFKECQNPDDAQRKDLSRQLGLDHHQIKFWFQNKRTQNKNHQERYENAQLRAENDRLRAESQRCREAIAIARCRKCGGKTAMSEMSFEEHQLLFENAGLAQEIRRLSTVVATGKPGMNYTLTTPPVPARPFEGMGSNRREVYESIGNLPGSVLRVKDVDKPLIIELAVVAMEELMVMARVDEPLWNIRANGTSLALNLNEYTRTFRNGLGSIQNGFKTEASKATSDVFMNHMDIVQMQMDVNLWSTMFARMVARAISHDTILTGGQGNFDGAFHLMTAEYQVLSPVVSTRECYFVRYCKQQGDGIWAVVDVSIDHLFRNLEPKCRKRPSGCLIQQMHDGFCKVTWVEHVEVHDREVHPLYKSLISSGQALSAERWVETLERQCERLAYIMAPNVPSIEPDGLIMITSNAKHSLLRIAERMTRSFLSGVANSGGDIWFNLSGNTGNIVRVMTRKSLNDPGRPVGVILYASTSFWLPVPPNTVFDFLRDANNRTNWDVVSTGGEDVQLMSQIGTGRDSRNCVSLLRTLNTSQKKMMMIQETSTDPTASFVIYAPVDVSLTEKVLMGDDPESVPLLPMGFAILPDGTAQHGRGGSLLSAAFQVLVATDPSAMLSFSSVATTENLILTTAHKIKAHFSQQTV